MKGGGPKAELNKDYLEKVYRIVGYAVIKLNNEGNRAALRFGSYDLELARPPIFIEDYLEDLGEGDAHTYGEKTGIGEG